MKHYYAGVDNEDHTAQVVHSFTCRDCRDSFVAHHDLATYRFAYELPDKQKDAAVKHTRCPSWKWK